MFFWSDIEETCKGINNQQIGIKQHLRAQRHHNGILSFKFHHTAGKQLHPVVIHQAQQFFRPSDVGAQPNTIEKHNIAAAQYLNQNDTLEVLRLRIVCSTARDA